ncbi:MAG TPA: hypothetical protein VD835_06065, partial [Pyrinomonadaceae bacterium]|nr:hypothetical protein [Pyrinomonadaceae bacterium]
MRPLTPRNAKKNRRTRLSLWLWCVALACALACAAPRAHAQLPNAGRTEARRDLEELVRRAINVACAERELDPQGSAPIDEMQAQPSLPLRHAEVLAGT